MDKYLDIINMPYVKSKKYKHMSIESRSSQFAPFAALTGYNEAIIETSRITSKKIILDDGLKDIINEKLNYIDKNKKNVYVSITHFKKDKKKDGGEYINSSGYVKKIDKINLYVQLDTLKINIDDIIDINIDNKF